MAKPGRNINGEPMQVGKKKLKGREASSFHEHSLGISKDKKFKKVAKGNKMDPLEHTKIKKRKQEGKGTLVESSEGGMSTASVHEIGVFSGKKSKSSMKKSKLLENKKQKKSKKKADVISESNLPSNDNQSSEQTNFGHKAHVLDEISDSQGTEEASVESKSKGMKKKKIRKIIESQSNQILEKEDIPSKAESEDVEEIQLVDEDCSRRMKKKKLKTRKLMSKGNQILEKQDISSKAESENVEEIQGVDEDCSRGMKKWLIQYHESRPSLEVLHNRIDEFITSYEAQKEQERIEREAQAAEGGWTVVVHHKGRKKTTDSESGIAVGSVAQAAVLDNEAKKKPKEVPLDFYRFQKREAQRNEIMLLQSKFEQDKKRIQQLRASRKFRPY